MEYAVISVPAAPIRRKPMHRKEMVNQLLFGEAVKVLKARGDLWVKIRSLHDNYEGWMTNTMLEEVSETVASTRNIFATTDLLSTISISGKKMNIPFGSSLPFFDKGKGKLATSNYTFTGGFFKTDEQVPSSELIKNFTAQWLNTPYL